MTALIFLDMDGVLNSEEFFNSNRCVHKDTLKEIKAQSFDWWTRMIDPLAVHQLNTLIQRTNAKVVISSSWRHHCSSEEMQQLLNGCGFQGEVIGSTPKNLSNNLLALPGLRGQEIQVWITENKDILKDDGFVILDDLGKMSFGHLSPYLIQTSYQKGLLEEHVNQAVVLINKNLLS